MSADLHDSGRALLDEIGRRWRTADPLLPAPAALVPGEGCGVLITLPGTNGRLQAAGGCEHWHGEADDLELTWGAARRFRLAVLAGSLDLAAALDELVGLWRVHLAAVPGTDDPDSAAVIMWPSRDVEGVRILLQRGLAPRSVVAARAARRRPAGAGPAVARPAAAGLAGAGPAGPGPEEAGPAAAGPAGAGPAGQMRQGRAPADSALRRAGLADLDAVVRLGLAVIRYDAFFGGVIERPSAAAALRDEVARLLGEPQPWIWLAERDGAAIGVLIAEPPSATGWIAPLVGSAPVAYNSLTFVQPAERGTGLADALVSRFHAAANADDVPVTLLHYEQTNPLSAPFWSRHGYRPLWTSWEARPACALR